MEEQPCLKNEHQDFLDYENCDHKIIRDEKCDLEERLEVMKKAAFKLRGEDFSHKMATNEHSSPRDHGHSLDYANKHQQDKLPDSQHKCGNDQHVQNIQADEFVAIIETKCDEEIKTESLCVKNSNEFNKRNCLNYNYEKTTAKYIENKQDLRNYNNQEENIYKSDEFSYTKQSESERRCSGRIKPAPRSILNQNQKAIPSDHQISQNVSNPVPRVQSTVEHIKNQDNIPLQLNPLIQSPKISKPTITTNFMGNELLLLEQKIAGLEQKLSGCNTQKRSNSHKYTLDVQPLTTHQEYSRFEVNLEKFEGDITQGKSQNNSVTKFNFGKSNSKKKIDKERNLARKTKSDKKFTSRRPESSGIKVSRNKVHKNYSTNPSKKNLEGCSKRLKQMQTFEKSASRILKSKSKVDDLREVKSTRSFKKITNSSTKNPRKSNTTAVVPHECKIFVKNELFPMEQLARHPNALLILFRNLKVYHSKALLAPSHNKVVQMVYFIFCPYIICICLIMKHLVAQSKMHNLTERKNSKVYMSKEKPDKGLKADVMLLELKNQEIQEEQAKNSELRSHIDALKKRIYSKTEFEGQSKVVKEASEMIDQLKAKIPTLLGNKYKKEHKEISTSLSSVIKKLKPKGKKLISKPKSSKKLSQQDNCENSSLLMNQIREADVDTSVTDQTYSVHPIMEETIKVSIKKKKTARPKKESKPSRRHIR
ncbi:unnamed protein product [Moneuplotes crassus]|uniref:Uncharacterized protein n=1 Tax=Euplotes crassus TaxID=5936 RepID=A0AAD1XUA8_EUPCR|nr:unnamed protein product [Moneuplotes crassus]